MTNKIRHADGRELEVTEETFTDVYQGQGFERVDEGPNLAALTRDQLNAHAENLAIADPAHYPNRAALIEAIENAQAAVEQAVEEQTAEEEGEQE
jgi:hypothetical protein